MDRADLWASIHLQKVGQGPPYAELVGRTDL